MLLSTGRLAFDFGCLLATLQSDGGRSPTRLWCLWPTRWPVCSRSFPSRPAGSGSWRPGSAALLILAGIPSGDAVVATLAYRIISYWLPMFVGPFAYLAFRRRYGPPGVSGGPALATG